MAKYKKRGGGPKAKEREKEKERDRDVGQSTDQAETEGETSREPDATTEEEPESPTPKRRKTKEVPKGRGRFSKSGKSQEPTEDEVDEKDDSEFDPKKPYHVAMKSLNSIIVCSLCEGYLIDATTITECLHTFCKSCLLKYFEEEDNCCPHCGQLIHQSHPTNYIAYDRTLQDIVYKLVPGLHQGELEQRTQFVRSQKNEDDLKEEERLAKEKQKELERDRTNRCFEGSIKKSHHRNEAQMVVELIRGAEDLPEPERRFIRTGEMCTVTTLKRYLSFAMYGTKNRYMEMDLFCNDELMGRDFSMKFIHLTRCRRKPPDAPLRLVYKHRLDF